MAHSTSISIHRVESVTAEAKHFPPNANGSQCRAFSEVTFTVLHDGGKTCMTLFVQDGSLADALADAIRQANQMEPA